jgi:hypothetical protein
LAQAAKVFEAPLQPELVPQVSRYYVFWRFNPWRQRQALAMFTQGGDDLVPALALDIVVVYSVRMVVRPECVSGEFLILRWQGGLRISGLLSGSTHPIQPGLTTLWQTRQNTANF